MFKELLSTITLKEIMTTPVMTVNEEEDFHVVQDKFSTYDIRHLPVINHSRQVVGLISQRHLYKIHSPRRLESGEWFYDKDELDAFILKNVMVREPFVLKSTHTLQDAMKAMVQFKLGCIPIVDDIARPVGIITRDSIISFFLKHE